jgi:hypothetical protein
LDPLPTVVVEAGAAVVDGDGAQPAKSAITAHVDAAATSHPRLGFDFTVAFLLSLQRVSAPFM